MEDVSIVAKLKLDTTEAEKQLEGLSAKGDKSVAQSPIKVDKGTTSSLKDLFSGDKGLKNVGKLARAATNGLSGLAGGLSGLAAGASQLAGVLAIVAAAIAVVLKLLQGTDTMDAMKSSIRDLLNTLREALAPVLSAVGEIVITLVELLKPLLKLLDPIAATVRLLLTPLMGTLKVLQPIFNLVGKLLELTNSLSSIFSDTLLGILESIFQIVVALFEIALKPLFDVLDVLIGFFETLKQTIQNFITDLTFGLITFDTGFVSTQGKVANYKTSLDTWQTSGDLVSEELEESKKTNTLLERLSTLWEEVKKIWEKVKEFVGSFFSTLWEGLVNSLVSIGVGAKNAVENAFSVFSKDTKAGFGGGLFTSQGRWGDGYQLGDAIGTVVDFAAGLFGKGWLWADGGTLDVGAQIWGMNEKGNPEFLFNAGGHDSVINAEILSDAVAAGMRKAGASNQRLEVSVKDGLPAGPRELASWLLPSLKFLLSR